MRSKSARLYVVITTLTATAGGPVYDGSETEGDATETGEEITAGAAPEADVTPSVVTKSVYRGDGANPEATAMPTTRIAAFLLAVVSRARD